MKQLLVATCLVVGLTGNAIADDPKPTATEEVAPAEGPTPEWMKETAVAPETGSNKDLLQKLNEVKDKYEDLKGANGGKMLLVFLLLAAICNVLISGVKRVRKLTDKGKKYLPWVALGLGVVAGFAAYYGTGASIIEAFWYGAGPPSSVLIQELFGPIKSKPVEDSD